MAILAADNLTNLTRDIEIPLLVDQIFTGNQFLFRMRAENSVKYSGGTNVDIELGFNKNVGGPFSGYDSLSLADVDFAVRAQVPWKHYYTPIVISREARLKNMGDEAKVIDLLDAKREHARVHILDNVGDGLMSDGTGTGGKEITGLRAILSTTASLYGVSASTYSTWRATIDSTTNTLTTNSIRNLILNTTIGGERPTDLVTTKAVFGKYLDLVESNQRHPSTMDVRSQALANAGFEVASMDGVPLYFDEKVPGSGGGSTDNYLMALNLNHLKLMIHSDDDFTVEPFQTAIDQAAMRSFIFVTLNLMCSSRRLQGAMTALDPNL